MAGTRLIFTAMSPTFLFMHAWDLSFIFFVWRFPRALQGTFGLEDNDHGEKARLVVGMVILTDTRWL